MARISFSNGLKADPGNSFVCHAWGLMEQRAGHIDRAREIFEASLGGVRFWEICRILSFAIIFFRDVTRHEDNVLDGQGGGCAAYRYHTPYPSGCGIRGCTSRGDDTF